jgi:phosphoribosylformylglycinamidine cyclo-ligase
MSTKQPSLTYRDAGVDIAAADALVQQIARLAKSTHTPGVLPNRGEYAGLFEPNLAGLHRPTLAATCDGVGTKLLVARAMQHFEPLGQDLVAMNVNDLLPCGARPLFFLDYIACGSLQPDALQSLVRGMAQACKSARCALLGGETAEMPGVYAAQEFDVAGFAVGLVEGQALRTPAPVAAGDAVLALPASGVHSNGFSLARQALLQRGGYTYDSVLPALGNSLGMALLTPTPIYVAAVLQLLEILPVKAAAHVTGGGLLGRGKKMLPPGLRLVLQRNSYPVPPIFALIAEAGNVTDTQMGSTFNMGLGYLAVVAPQHAAAHAQALQDLGFLRVGHVHSGEPGIDFV